MGLDIMLFKCSESGTKHIISKDELAEIQSVLPTYKENVDYYDFDAIGLTEDKWELSEMNGNAYGFIDKTHPLYRVLYAPNGYYTTTKSVKKELKKYDCNSLSEAYAKILRVVPVEEIPIKTVERDVVKGTEAGYQRKGMNSQFYEDYSDRYNLLVARKSELENIRDKYCADEEVKSYFDETFVQPFLEGKMYVIFDW